jgi:phosphatidylglycerol:prolipoprotein diacylglycerol transferase
MFPILFRWGDLALYSYHFFFGLAFLAGLFAWKWSSRRIYHIESDSLVGLSFGSLGASIIGAKFWTLLFLNSWTWSVFLDSGLSSFGGIVGAVLFLFWGFRHFKIPLESGFESASVGVCFALTIFRLGCLLNGCCHGSHCPIDWLSISYLDPQSAMRPLGEPVYPVPLLESLGCLAIGLKLLKSPAPFHRRYSAFLVFYGALRLALTLVRESPQDFIGPVILLVSGFWLDLRSRRGHKMPHES